MPSILELMSEEDAKKAIQRGRKRLDSSKAKKQSVSPEVFILSELGYYYGWDAVMSARKNEITLDEVMVYLEGARKVWYSKLIEQAGTTQIANGSLHSKQPSDSFKKGMAPYIDRANLGE